MVLEALAGCGGEKKDTSIAATAHDDASVLPVPDPVQDAPNPTPVTANVVTEARYPLGGHVITSAQTISTDLSESDSAFISVVQSADSFQIDTYPFMRTNVHLAATETIRGSADAIVTINGGRVGEVSVLSPHAPPFEIGKKFLVFTLSHQVREIFPCVDPDSVQIHGEVVPLSSVRSLSQGATP